MRTHWVLVVMDQYTRRIIGFGVHAGTIDGAALCRMFNRAIRGQHWMPRYLSSDNDPLYRFHQWQTNLRILEVAEIKSVPYVPLSHPFVERLIGTVRREYLDHILFWTTADLENKLLDFRTYFNNHRTHDSLEGRTPDTSVSRPIANLRSIRWQPHCRAPVPDAGGRLIYLSLALAVVFGRPRQNFQEIVRCFPIATPFPDRIDSLLQMRSESGTHHTLETR
jgi:putative transposase